MSGLHKVAAMTADCGGVGIEQKKKKKERVLENGGGETKVR